MEGSQEEATAVALRALGKTVPTPHRHRRTRADVEGQGPARGRRPARHHRRPADHHHRGRARRAPEGRSPARRCPSTVARKGKEQTVDVPTDGGPRGAGPPSASCSASRHDFPAKVTIDAGAIGGPSAGLMFSLGIYDKLTPGPLAGGRQIAGTGTIDDQGQVGPDRRHPAEARRRPRRRRGVLPRPGRQLRRGGRARARRARGLQGRHLRRGPRRGRGDRQGPDGLAAALLTRGTSRAAQSSKVALRASTSPGAMSLPVATASSESWSRWRSRQIDVPSRRTATTRRTSLRSGWAARWSTAPRRVPAGRARPPAARPCARSRRRSRPPRPARRAARAGSRGSSSSAGPPARWPSGRPRRGRRAPSARAAAARAASRSAVRTSAKSRAGWSQPAAATWRSVSRAAMARGSMTGCEFTVPMLPYADEPGPVRTRAFPSGHVAVSRSGSRESAGYGCRRRPEEVAHGSARPPARPSTQGTPRERQQLRPPAGQLQRRRLRRASATRRGHAAPDPTSARHVARRGGRPARGHRHRGAVLDRGAVVPVGRLRRRLQHPDRHQDPARSRRGSADGRRWSGRASTSPTATVRSTPRRPTTQAMEHYRELVEPMRRTATIAAPLAIGLFAGLSAATQWDTFLLWRNGSPFGTTDPEFGLDIGFFVFDLPWINFVVAFLTMILVIGFITAAFTHYLYGGIVAGAKMRSTQAARVHLSVIAAALVLVRAVAFWVDRYNLATAAVDEDHRHPVHRVARDHPDEGHPGDRRRHVRRSCSSRRSGPAPGASRSSVSPCSPSSSSRSAASTRRSCSRSRCGPSEKSLEVPYIQRNIDATRGGLRASERRRSTSYDTEDRRRARPAARRRGDGAGHPPHRPQRRQPHLQAARGEQGLLPVRRRARRRPLPDRRQVAATPSSPPASST